MVASILVREGQTVNAVQNAPTVLRLANMATMTVKAQISEADVVNVTPGASVYFTIHGDPQKKYYGTLRTIELFCIGSHARFPLVDCLRAPMLNGVWINSKHATMRTHR